MKTFCPHHGRKVCTTDLLDKVAGADHQPASPGPPADQQPASPAPPADQQPASPAPPADQQPASPAPPADQQPASPAPPADQQPASPAPPADQQPASPAPPADQQLASPAPQADQQPVSPAPPADQQLVSPASPHEIAASKYLNGTPIVRNIALSRPSGSAVTTTALLQPVPMTSFPGGSTTSAGNVRINAPTLSSGSAVPGSALSASGKSGPGATVRPGGSSGRGGKSLPIPAAATTTTRSPLISGNILPASGSTPTFSQPTSTTWPPAPEGPKILIFFLKFLNAQAARNSLTIR